MNLKPALGKVIVEIKKKDEKIGNTKLVIPIAAQEKELGFGLCLSGEYKDRQVYFKKYSGDEIERDGKIYFIIDEEDLLAILE